VETKTEKNTVVKTKRGREKGERRKGTKRK